MTHRIAAPFLALFVLICLAPAAAAATGPATITLSPANPQPGQTVTATIRATWPDSCVPSAVSVTTAGHRIRVEAAVTPCDVGCLTVITNYTLTATFTAPAAPGAYDIEYTTLNCFGVRRVQGTQELIVNSGSCAFPISLRAERSSIRVGEPVVLSWCNPSTQVPDNSFVVDFYRVYFSHSPSGPFQRAVDINGANNTSVQLTADTGDVGTLYMYVEAHGCTFTISGQCMPTVLVTNIIAIDVTTATGCLSDTTTLCLDQGRFSVRARWRAANANGDGRPVRLTDESGYFWFFEPGNVEVTVKVLNACNTSAPRFWVFAAGMTNVEVDLTVTDMKNNTVKTYRNALNNPFAPILDTNAFATCP